MRRLTPIMLAWICISAPAAPSEVRWLDMQANGIAVTQAGGGNSFSAQVAWTPQWFVSETISLRGVLGGTVLKSSFGNKFIALTYEVLAVLPVWGRLSVEGGGGLQTWVDNAGTHPVASGNLAYSTNWFGLQNRIFFGYSRFFLSGNGTNEIRLGMGASL